jgi:HAD superfamily hydrolase (TIGR01509 family)
MGTVVDAVVFDLDGVLIDSEPVWERVRRGYVDKYGGTWQPDTQHRLMGMSTGEWARYLSGELGVRRTPDEVARDVVDQMAAAYAEWVPLVPHAVDVVRALAGRWPLGLATSAPARLIDVVLAAADLTGAFRVTLSTEGVPHGKPAPDVYATVARRMAVDPARCVAVEDSSNGVRSAAAAGMRVIAVPHERYPLAPDAADRAALTVRTIAEVTPEVVAALP